MAKVRVILKQKVRYPAGFKLRIYGHEFIVQKDGTAAAMIDESFLKNEIANSRYILAEEIAQEEAPELDTRYVDSFGYDIGQYYGAGSLEKLKEKISKLRKDELTFFAKTRLGKEFPFNIGKSRMVFEIIDVIRTENNPEEPKPAEKNTEDNTAEPNSKPKMAFTCLEPDEKTVNAEAKASPIKEKTREEIMAELDELEQLANQRKTEIKSEGKK